jgi:site-specific DNA recombinase
MFLQHESLDRVVEELRKLGWTTKAWTSKSGRNHPGRAFQPKSLKRMLTNPLYAGRIEYRREIYQGEHQAIIEAKVWEEASRRLTAESRGPNRTQRLHLEAILTGLLYCEQCHTPMLPTYTNKGPRRYRYYVCRKTRTEGWHSCLIRSVSAPVVENAVLEQLYSRGSATESAPVNADHAQLIRSKVARIGYDGVEGTATLEMKE